MGGSGVLVHLLILNWLISNGVVFLWANLASSLVAMTSNFLLNNFITFNNIHPSLIEKTKGLAKYYLGNSISLFANVGVATQLKTNELNITLSALGGIFAGVILNFLISKSFVFKLK